MKKYIAFICLALAAFQITSAVKASFSFKRDYLFEWSLADKSSTIEDKTVHISNFIQRLEAGHAGGGFAGHDALFLQQPDNSFAANLVALKSLQKRLVEIGDLEPDSFQYNTAIQQITAQEQGEAGAMLKTFKGCYQLSQYPITWGWVGIVILCLWLLPLVLIVAIWVD